MLTARPANSGKERRRSSKPEPSCRGRVCMRVLETCFHSAGYDSCSVPNRAHPPSDIPWTANRPALHKFVSGLAVTDPVPPT